MKSLLYVKVHLYTIATFPKCGTKTFSSYQETLLSSGSQKGGFLRLRHVPNCKSSLLEVGGGQQWVGTTEKLKLQDKFVSCSIFHYTGTFLLISQVLCVLSFLSQQHLSKTVSAIYSSTFTKDYLKKKQL